MHCKELKKKKWVCVADGPRDPATGKRKQISRRAQTRSEAKKKVEAALEELEYSFSYAADISFGNYTSEWYAQYVRRGRKETTNKTRQFSINAMNEYLQAVSLKNINSKMYQSLLNDLFDSGRSNSTIKMIHATARMIFAQALEEKVIKMNPTSSAFIPQKKTTVEDIENGKVAEMYLEPNELGKFLREVDQYRNYVYVVLIYLIAFTGMRPGEALALRLADVSFTTSRIHITKTLFRDNRLKHEYEVTPPKTMSSIRTVDVDPKIMEMIKRLAGYKETCNYEKSEYLFSTADGHPPTVDLLRQVVGRIGEKTDLSKPVYTYMLRHTHISMLAEAGVSLPEIMKRVGHKNENTTTQVYLHVTEKMREATISKMDNLFGDLMNSERFEG